MQTRQKIPAKNPLRALAPLALVFCIFTQAAYSQGIPCYDRTIPKPGTVERLKQALSSPGFNLLQQGVAVVGELSENKNIKAVGTAMQMASILFSVIQRQSGPDVTLQVCTSTSRGLAGQLGFGSLNLIGTSQSMRSLAGGNSLSEARVQALLAPFSLPAVSSSGNKAPPLSTALPSLGMLQGTVSGTVVDVSGRPLAGAIVTLIPSPASGSATQSVVASLWGRFSFDDDQGQHTVLARLDGFSDQTQDVAMGPLPVQVRLIMLRSSGYPCQFTVFNRMQFGIELYTDASPPHAVIPDGSHLVIQLQRPTTLSAKGILNNASWQPYQAVCGGLGWVEMTP